MVGFTFTRFSLALLVLLLSTICVDEVPAPRSRPTTVRQGNGGAITTGLKTHCI